MGTLNNPGGGGNGAGTSVVRRGVYCSGGQGTGSTSPRTLTDMGMRLVVRLPVSTSRWRIKIRNFRANSTAAQGALTGTGIAIGGHLIGSLGAETGNFVNSTSVSLVAAGFTIPGDGTYYVSPWFTDAPSQFTAGAEHLVALGYTCTSQAIYYSTGSVWEFTGANAVLGAATGGTRTGTGTAIDYQIEYEAATDRKTILAVTDSIGEGVGAQTSQIKSLHLSYPRLWASRHSAQVVNLGQSGTTSFDWGGDTTVDRWTRVDTASLLAEYGYIAMGSNDAANGQTLGAFQSYMWIIYKKLAALCVPGAPIFLATITPRSLTTTNEALRVSYNSWIRTLPLGASGVVDLDLAMASVADATILPTAYTSDNTHFTRVGDNVAANTMGATVSP